MSSHGDNTDNDAAIAMAIAEQENTNMLLMSARAAAAAMQPENHSSSLASSTSISCPRNCGLLPYQVPPSGSWRCNVCGKQLQVQDKVYSCINCNFDACAACHDGTGSPITNGLSPVVDGSSSNPTTTRATTTPRPSSRPSSSTASRPTTSPYPAATTAPPKSSHMCIVPCVISGTCVEMMVDSGACSSVISMELVKLLKLEPFLDKRQSGIAMGVGQAKICGKLVQVPCELGHVEFAIDFMVLDVSHQQLLLLGLDQMRKYKCIIDLESDSLIFGGTDGVRVAMLTQDVQPKMSLRSGDACNVM